jgi:hypothetical protein
VNVTEVPPVSGDGVVAAHNDVAPAFAVTMHEPCVAVVVITPVELLTVQIDVVVVEYEIVPAPFDVAALEGVNRLEVCGLRFDGDHITICGASEITKGTAVPVLEE